MSLSSAFRCGAGEPLRCLLERAGVTRSSTVLVTGPSGLAALLWLIRHGYDQAAYLRSSIGCGHERADALLIPRTCDAPALEHVLRSGPLVRGEGVLVFQSRAGAAPVLERLLQRHDFSLERRLHGAHRDVTVARRLARLQQRAA